MGYPQGLSSRWDNNMLRWPWSLILLDSQLKKKDEKRACCELEFQGVLTNNGFIIVGFFAGDE